jgi:K+-transporting ATPase ATPase C chain
VTRDLSAATIEIITGTRPMLTDFRRAAILFLLLTIITGLIYPGIVTAIAEVVMPHQAKGSLIVRDGKVLGSDLIGQPFSDPKYFWGRPSATSPQPYNGLASSGSNQAMTNAALADAVKDRIAALRATDPDNQAPIPADLVTASASGLDPHVSPSAADYQIGRVARARGIDTGKVRSLVGEHTEGRQFGLLGEPRVNVLALNLALDALR